MVFHIAQINVARTRATLDDPLMAGFVRRLDDVNAAADASPGFIWRLQEGNGSSAYITAYDDPLVIVNMSVWESVASFREYVYRSVHVDVMKQRREWFGAIERPNVALWWIPAGHTPTVAEGMRRLAMLREHGESRDAFTMLNPFDPPSPAGQTDPMLSAGGTP